MGEYVFLKQLLRKVQRVWIDGLKEKAASPWWLLLQTNMASHCRESLGKGLCLLLGTGHRKLFLKWVIWGINGRYSNH